MPSVEQFSNSPNVLAPFYNDAQVALKLMMTGHVYQASPDIAQLGYLEHWECQCKHGPERLDIEHAKTEQVRESFAQLIGSRSQNVALASSVHELFVRFLSCLDFSARKKIITSGGEHPSILRQLVRLKAFGIELIVLEPRPASSLVERVLAQLDDRTLAVCIATVDCASGHQVFELDTLIDPCLAYGAELFVDAYQSINVLPFSIEDYLLEQAFVVGGGAKYCHMGDGNCFLHVPYGREFEPVVSGWFGVFDPALDTPAAEPLAYADSMGQRFDGSTRDTMPYFRAAKVFEFFQQQQLTPELLHDINHHQLTVMAQAFSDLDLPPALIKQSTSVEFLAGFMTFKTPKARRLQELMRDIGVVCDYSQDFLRLGPAPYLSDEQLLDSIEALRESVNNL